LKWTLVPLLFLIIAAVIFVNTDFGQNLIARRVALKLSKTLKARVSVKHISFTFFNKMNLEGLYIEDQKKDTLLYAGTAQVRITDWFIFKDKAVLKYVNLENGILYINRTDSIWNYRFLQDYFNRGGGKGNKEGIAFDLKKLELRNVYVVKKDAWLGQDMVVRLKAMDLDAELIDFSAKKININSISFSEPLFHLKNYQKLKPSRARQESPEEVPASQVIDSMLKWNLAGWKVHVGELKIDNGTFKNQKLPEKNYNDFFDS